MSKRTRTNTNPEIKQGTHAVKTSEELAFMLNQSYQMIIQAQNNIININRELERRQLESIKKKKEQSNG